MQKAANTIGISKKTLDDYFFQLKCGKKNGFNFNEHKSDKFGMLRAFNKKCSQKEAQLRKAQPKQI